MSSVFILHHTYGNSESESYKILGVFSTKTKANSEISKYLELPEFKEFPNGFTVTDYALDESHWLSGFEGAQSVVIEDR
ncbi:hypothetical protein [Pseudomonas aeruginosa]|uniref:DUF7336 domain-containing protein n=1 Tax=Pseudomonas aeruginosa TaxID=287 RepID=UPI002F42702D|nr:hypothetical protein [Pseudomonas aeruginosa]HBO6094065.1 hypothetical protein [Pseudomonas aeruginosa]HCL3835509.1 hypothetical protein [Pseudomonas aeruginosa]